MATDRPIEPTGTLEPEPRQESWLRRHRVRIALVIAVLEGLFVAVSNDYSRWSIITVAIIILALYVLWGRNMESETGRQIFWIAGLSQSLAVLVTIFSFIVFWLSLIVAGVFAAIALLFLLSDRG